MKLIDFSRKLESEEACEKYLKEQREKEGIVCYKCGGKKHYRDLAGKSWRCSISWVARDINIASPQI